VREAKEVERRSIKTRKKISFATLKADRTDRRVSQELGPHRGAAGHLERVRGEGGAVPLQLPRPGRAGRIQYKTRPATPEKLSAEQHSANEHDRCCSPSNHWMRRRSALLAEEEESSAGLRSRTETITKAQERAHAFQHHTHLFSSHLICCCCSMLGRAAIRGGPPRARAGSPRRSIGTARPRAR
jgi:hypothetical protein